MYTRIQRTIIIRCIRLIREKRQNILEEFIITTHETKTKKKMEKKRGL